mmetsp:Transcript_49593/g.162161  ORF Transcript_49593/g.162161 Transcript_49593/m.162161 type:complete len:184 (-) Transcript_49593:180-731(-)
MSIISKSVERWSTRQICKRLPPLWTIALALTTVEIFAGLKIIATALGVISPCINIAPLVDYNTAWMEDMLHGSADPAVAICTFFGSALLCVGTSALVALSAREAATRHGCTMFGGIHTLLAVGCVRFAALDGLFPNGFYYHGFAAALFWAPMLDAAIGKRLRSRYLPPPGKISGRSGSGVALR